MLAKLSANAALTTPKLILRRSADIGQWITKAVSMRGGSFLEQLSKFRDFLETLSITYPAFRETLKLFKDRKTLSDKSDHF